MMFNLNNNKISQLMPLSGFLLIWLVVFWGTLTSMVEMWIISDTFSHAFLIFPISLFLIWQKRYLFFNIKKQINYSYIIILAFLVLGWILGDMVNVNIVKQFMIILMLPVAIASIYGTKVLKTYLFPLLYLLFSVPFGEFLIPKLQDITAYISVLGLQLTGIPVYLEALYISIPTGDFEVAVACSGIRYLIASLALGTLYAYLTYQKTYKRVIFIIFAIIIPIIANGIRAYGIMIIAHLSDMKYATGVDHLIYGWLFFGVIIFFLFYIGNRWGDEIPESDDNQISTEQELNIDNIKQQTYSEYKTVFFIFLIFLIAPLSNIWFSQQTGDLNKSINLGQLISSENHTYKKTSNWNPVFYGSDIEINQAYQINNHILDLYLAYYRYPAKGKELVNSTNTLFDLKKYKLLDKNTPQVNIHGDKIILDEYQLSSSHTQRVIWGWYYVFGQSMTREIKIKLLQAAGKLSGISVDGSYIAISSRADNVDQARQELTDFLSRYWISIKKEID